MTLDIDAVILSAAGKHSATVLWLHGLGADGNDFVPVAGELGLPAAHGVKFIFPHAPVRPVTINNGYPMRAWYDITSLARLDQQDDAGINASTERMHALLDAERASGIASERLIVAGFSQGCAMALHAGLRYGHRLGGVLGLSGYLPVHTRLAAEAHAANKATPVMLMHGTQDAVVAMGLGLASKDLLLAQGYPVQWRTYGMAHSVHPDQIDDIGVWLRQVLAI